MAAFIFAISFLRLNLLNGLKCLFATLLREYPLHALRLFQAGINQ